MSSVLSVTINSLLLSVIKLSAIMLSVTMLSVIKLRIIMLNVIRLSVIMLSVVGYIFYYFTHLLGPLFTNFNYSQFILLNFVVFLVNRTAQVRHQCRKTTVLSCHRRLIITGVEKLNSI